MRCTLSHDDHEDIFVAKRQYTTNAMVNRRSSLTLTPRNDLRNLGSTMNMVMTWEIYLSPMAWSHSKC